MKRLTLLLSLPLLTSLACTDDGPSTDDEIGTDGSTGDGDGDTTTGTETGTETSTTETDETETDTTETDTTETDTDTTETDTDTDTDTETTEGALCGDGIVDGDEECDAGPENADDAECTSSCTLAICGDGLIYAGIEDCDAMGESVECNDDCSASACGDSKLNVSAGELCDGDVGMVSCVDEGFLGGELACDAMSCDYDTAGCFLDDFQATFSNCAQVGHTGPSQAQCDAAYTNTSLAGAVTVAAGYQSWTVPFTATYTIEVWGAQGGNHNFGNGGNGARVQGDFDLNQGDVLQIVVGQKGKDGTAYDVGGGGGTFVALADDTPLIVAGGGGGAGNCGGIDLPSMIGKALLGDGTGGTGGGDGNWCGCGGDGSPGGGFTTNGMPSGGDSFLNGAVGDDTERPNQCIDSGLGGFGGGGNGGNGGGGGGGYEGGDGGGQNGGSVGKGGESYNDGANPEGEDGIKTGHGQVLITLLP